VSRIVHVIRPSGDLDRTRSSVLDEPTERRSRRRRADRLYPALVLQEAEGALVSRR
jgi:hypothetical protein